MSKDVGKSLSTFLHNVRTHAKRVVGGRESAAEALADVVQDVKKVGHAVERGALSDGRKKAKKLTENGRKSYNKKDYSEAEGKFRKAVAADPLFGLAHLYLGHTLYKLNKHEEAVQEWRKTITVDPDSDAALKAQSKLRRIDKQFDDAINRLQNP